MKTLPAVFTALVLAALYGFSFTTPSDNSVGEETYSVKTRELTIRSGAGTEFPVIKKYKREEWVTVVDKTNVKWWKVKLSPNNFGFAYAKYLGKVPEDQIGDAQGWVKMDLVTGEAPECFNFIELADENIDNYLAIKVNIPTIDAIVKLIDPNLEECIRYAYVNGGQTYYMRNIPQGVYTLKIASGQDFRVKYDAADFCRTKFMQNAKYEELTAPLDFNIYTYPQGSKTITKTPNHTVEISPSGAMEDDKSIINYVEFNF